MPVPRWPQVFTEDIPPDSTFADVALLEEALKLGPGKPKESKLPFITRPYAGGPEEGGVFVHSRKTKEPMPTFVAPARCGVPTLDAEASLRIEQLKREQLQAYSDFTMGGLSWAEQQVQADAAIRAQRAAEDAEIARIRFQEDAERNAKREQQDSERTQKAKREEGQWFSEREAAEVSLAQAWKTRWTELAASLEERFHDYQRQLALEEQKLREEEARVRQAAAEAATAEAEKATRETEGLEAARLEAELTRLRNSLQPSIASLLLVVPEAVPGALGYSQAGPQGLRKDDRSWWKCLHFLEAEGLTPPLKGTTVAAQLFDALDVDSDGIIPLAEAGYALSLLASGSARQRVDAACSCPGAPASGSQVSRVQATEQLELCAKVRLHCGPIVQAIHLKAAPAASAGAPAEAPIVPTTQALQREVAALYGSSTSLPAEQFRSWAVSCEPVFAALI